MNKALSTLTLKFKKAFLSIGISVNRSLSHFSLESVFKESRLRRLKIAVYTECGRETKRFLD